MQRGRREEISPEPLPLACDEPSSSSSKTEVELADAALLWEPRRRPLNEWRAGRALLSETSSPRKCARLRRGHLSTAESQEEGTRKRRRKQLMAEVLRVELREVLRNATSIYSSLAESKYMMKIVRYHADVERGAVRKVGASSGYCRAGALGIPPSIARRAAQPRRSRRSTPRWRPSSWAFFLTKFCAPPGGVCVVLFIFWGGHVYFLFCCPV